MCAGVSAGLRIFLGDSCREYRVGLWAPNISAIREGPSDEHIWVLHKTLYEKKTSLYGTIMFKNHCSQGPLSPVPVPVVLHNYEKKWLRMDAHELVSCTNVFFSTNI